VSDGFCYDADCEDLAESFLAEYPHTKLDSAKLAQTIQDAIEDWMRRKEEK